MRRISSKDLSWEEFLKSLRQRGGSRDREVGLRVQEILESLRLGGKERLLSWVRLLDGMPEQAESLEVHAEEWDRAQGLLPEEERRALEIAAERIREFHLHCLLRSWLTVDSQGCLLGQLVQPLERVGIYVPGGKAQYPSSVLMTAIPARVAGVKEVIMCSPLAWSNPSPAVLAAARIAGVDRVFRLGGPQAVGAMAYGVGEIPRVDKIVGPGNAYVTEAKRMLFGEVDIDMLAGPSEVLILADGTVRAELAAADMLSQAEHDESASALLVTPSGGYAEEVEESLEIQLAQSPRESIARCSLENYGAILVCRDMEEAFAVAAEVAPEHLELLVERPLDWLCMVKNAGAVFLGAGSPEAMGDYLAGPSHVLPTGGTARFSSPLGVEDFLKRTSIVGISQAGMNLLGPHALRMARLEGLFAHANSVHLRLEK